MSYKINFLEHKYGPIINKIETYYKKCLEECDVHGNGPDKETLNTLCEAFIEFSSGEMNETKIFPKNYIKIYYFLLEHGLLSRKSTSSSLKFSFLI